MCGASATLNTGRVDEGIESERVIEEGLDDEISPSADHQRVAVGGGFQHELDRDMPDAPALFSTTNLPAELAPEPSAAMRPRISVSPPARCRSPSGCAVG